MKNILLLNGDIAVGSSIKGDLETEWYTIDYITKLSDLAAKLESRLYDLLITECILPTGTDKSFMLPRDCFDAQGHPFDCENYIVPVVKNYQPTLPILFLTMKRDYDGISMAKILATNSNYSYLRIATSPSIVKQKILDILAAR